MDFSKAEPTVMHVDMNSCFATCEQQANPFLRGKPVAIAAYKSARGVILAASWEAKKLGIGTGSLVGEAKKIIPNLIVLETDPDKYRYIHMRLRDVLGDYTNKCFPKSIDEFVLFLDGMPVLRNKSVFEVGREIKMRIRKEIGEAITVSVGISTNKLLSKVASNLQKPDGLEWIDRNNFWEVYDKITLRDLPGINKRNEARLNVSGIVSVREFYESPLWKLRSAFRSILADYWYLWLRGVDTGGLDIPRRSFGNSYSPPSSNGGLEDLKPILMKLCVKTVRRMRRAGFGACGVSVALRFKKFEGWHMSHKLQRVMFEDQDVYLEVLKLLNKCPRMNESVHTVFVSCFELRKLNELQLSVFSDLERRRNLSIAIDKINDVWGESSVVSARMIKTFDSVSWRDKVPDRIGFGNVRELR